MDQLLANPKTSRCSLQVMITRSNSAQVWASSSAAFRLEKCNNAVLIVDGRAQQLKSSNGQARSHIVLSFYTSHCAFSLMSTIVRDFELLWRICGP